MNCKATAWVLLSQSVRIDFERLRWVCAWVAHGGAPARRPVRHGGAQSGRVPRRWPQSARARRAWRPACSPAPLRRPRRRLPRRPPRQAGTCRARGRRLCQPETAPRAFATCTPTRTIPEWLLSEQVECACVLPRPSATLQGAAHLVRRPQRATRAAVQRHGVRAQLRRAVPPACPKTTRQRCSLGAAATPAPADPGHSADCCQQREACDGSTRDGRD